MRLDHLGDRWREAKQSTRPLEPGESTHNVVIGFGPFEGTPYTRLPISYLLWLINQDVYRERAYWYAKEELKRRGTNLEGHVDITGHAIDRASTQCFDIYLDQRFSPDEGLHTFLSRLVTEHATWSSESKGEEHVFVHGMKLVIKWGHKFPVLVTVIRR